MAKRGSRNSLADQVIERVKEPKEEVPIKLISSGCDVLDLALGGGYPLGGMVNIVGDKSSGKTALAIQLIVSALQIYDKRLKFFYDKAEGGFRFKTRKMFNLDIIKKGQRRSKTVEDFSFNLREKLEELKKGEILIYVLDSFDGLTSNEIIELDDKKYKAWKENRTAKTGSYKAAKCKDYKEFFQLRMDDIEDKECLLVVVSQVIDNITSRFIEHTRTGGHAMDHFASHVVWLAQVKNEELIKKDRSIGIGIKGKVTKNKISYPLRKCDLIYLFDMGVDNVSSNIDYLYKRKTETGLLSSKRTKLNWDGEGYTKDALIKHIEDNDLEDELLRRVKEDWYKIEDEISPLRTRKKRY